MSEDTLEDDDLEFLAAREAEQQRRAAERREETRQQWAEAQNITNLSIDPLHAEIAELESQANVAESAKEKQQIYARLAAKKNELSRRGKPAARTVEPPPQMRTFVVEQPTEEETPHE